MSCRPHGLTWSNHLFDYYNNFCHHSNSVQEKAVERHAPRHTSQLVNHWVPSSWKSGDDPSGNWKVGALLPLMLHTSRSSFGFQRMCSSPCCLPTLQVSMWTPEKISTLMTNSESFGFLHILPLKPTMPTKPVQKLSAWSECVRVAVDDEECVFKQLKPDATFIATRVQRTSLMDFNELASSRSLETSNGSRSHFNQGEDKLMEFPGKLDPLILHQSPSSPASARKS